MGPAAAQPAAPAPSRVLSLSLCTDQLLLLLAGPGQAAAVTQLARDCRISAECQAALSVPAVRGTAEEVVALAPGLVMGLAGAASPAMQAARRLGVPVLEVQEARSLEDIRGQITQAAAALGQPARGAAVLAGFDRRLAAIPLPDQPPGARPDAAIYAPNGYTVGAGSLADAALARAGLDNFATRRGLDRYGVLPLEYLVMHKPDFLVTGAPGNAPSMAQALLQHPALDRAYPGRRVFIPGPDWICGTPATLDAVERLVRARLAYARQGGAQ